MDNTQDCKMNYYEMKEKLLKCIEDAAKEYGHETDINYAVSFLFMTKIADEEKAKEFVKVHYKK